MNPTQQTTTMASDPVIINDTKHADALVAEPLVVDHSFLKPELVEYLIKRYPTFISFIDAETVSRRLAVDGVFLYKWLLAHEEPLVQLTVNLANDKNLISLLPTGRRIRYLVELSASAITVGNGLKQKDAPLHEFAQSTSPFATLLQTQVKAFRVLRVMHMIEILMAVMNEESDHYATLAERRSALRDLARHFQEKAFLPNLLSANPLNPSPAKRRKLDDEIPLVSFLLESEFWCGCGEAEKYAGIDVSTHNGDHEDMVNQFANAVFLQTADFIIADWPFDDDGSNAFEDSIRTDQEKFSAAIAIFS